ncbi:MAG TPA: YciI family protein, partial [Bryobacteraceae bacterium]|nr:YciI family protein [Bryobacteraceae bacterium]
EWSQKPFTKDGKRLGDDFGHVIRAQNGKPRVTDGPYSETKEVLGGFYLIEAANYDEAVKLTLDHPHLAFGTVEVRKLWEP